MTIKFAEQKIHEARQRVAALNRELADLRRSHARSGARAAGNARGKPGSSRTATDHDVDSGKQEAARS
jgi:hypothetical protein